MPTAVIQREAAVVRFLSHKLQVFSLPDSGGRETLLREMPLHDVERVVLSEAVRLSSSAVSALLRAGAPVQLFTRTGRYLGGFLPAEKPHGATRLLQYRRVQEPKFVLRIAGKIVSAKLYNQRRVLQRLRLGRRRVAEGGEGQPPLDLEAVQSAEQRIGALMDRVRSAADLEELLGLEGAAAAAYYPAWARFLPPEFPFERRSTRPPLNPVNACVSFGATVLYAEAVAAIHARGLDPALGVYHVSANDRWSLALDFIEPFRPALVEALALDLFSHRMVDSRCFERREDGGVFLNESGRRKFFLQYEARMEREFLSEAVGCRTTLRRELERQALMFKAALEDRDAFEPFLIN